MSRLASDRMGGPYPSGLHGCEELADGSVLAVEDCTDAVLDSQEAEGCLVRGGMSEGKLEALGQALKRGKRRERWGCLRWEAFLPSCPPSPNPRPLDPNFAEFIIQVRQALPSPQAHPAGPFLPSHHHGVVFPLLYALSPSLKLLPLIFFLYLAPSDSIYSSTCLSVYQSINHLSIIYHNLSI